MQNSQQNPSDSSEPDNQVVHRHILAERGRFHIRQDINKFFENYTSDQKTILYPSSCKYFPEFQTLPFDNVILNSKGLRKSFKDGKVICLCLDNNQLLAYLKVLNISLDTIVIIRDGCCEGGNYECVAQMNFFGRLMPLIKNQIEFFNDHSRFRDKNFCSLVEEKQIDEIPEYLNLFIKRSDPLHLPLQGRRLQRNAAILKSKMLGKITVNLCHDSVWNQSEDFDKIYFIHRKWASQGLREYLRLPRFSRGSKNYQRSALFPNCAVYENVSENTILPYLLDANDNCHKKIAFIPFAKGKYEQIISEIMNWDLDYPKEITFFHLQVGDYKRIYNEISKI